MGAIMRVRAALLGLGPEDYTRSAQEQDVQGPQALAEIWRGDDEVGRRHRGGDPGQVDVFGHWKHPRHAQLPRRPRRGRHEP